VYEGITLFFIIGRSKTMLVSAKDLLQGRAFPICVYLSDPLPHALSLMLENDYSQLPVIDEQQKPVGLVTSDSILRGLATFGATIEVLLVRDVAENIHHRAFNAEVDILDILDVLSENAAILITSNSGHLIGIITNWDTAFYFRRRAEDIMLVEDVETALRDHIEAAYTDPKTNQTDNLLLEKIIASVTRKKPFDELTFGEYMRVLLHSDTWSRYGTIFNISADALGKMLDRVRNIRNQLAHFRGEISKSEREHLRFAATWFERNQPFYPEMTPLPVVEPVLLTALPVEEILEEDSRYAKLALYLQTQTDERVRLTFNEIEQIVGSELPKSAYQHRSWWANDAASHVQSQQWLDAGWRVSQINLTDQTVVFVKAKDREASYIAFFSPLLQELRQKADFTIRDDSLIGKNWVTVVYNYAMAAGNTVSLSYSFARGGRFRVELFIYTLSNDDKRLFEGLLNFKDEIEQAVGADLSWERLDNTRASRIAYYHAGKITNNQSQLEELRNWAVDAMIRFEQGIRTYVQRAVKEIK
jgi:predicted transcriptional regulator